MITLGKTKFLIRIVYENGSTFIEVGGNCGQLLSDEEVDLIYKHLSKKLRAARKAAGAKSHIKKHGGKKHIPQNANDPSYRLQEQNLLLQAQINDLGELILKLYEHVKLLQEDVVAIRFKKPKPTPPPTRLVKESEEPRA